MSYGKICCFVGCVLLGCGSNEAGSEGTAGTGSGGRASGGNGADDVAGSASGGKSSGDAGAAAGGKPSGQAGESPSDGGKAPEGEAGAGADGGASGTGEPEPLDALSCATVPFPGKQARPEAYRMSITFRDGTAQEVVVARGDAIKRPGTSDTQLLKAGLLVTQSTDEFAIRAEGLLFSVERGSGPPGVYRGTLDTDGTPHAITCWRADLKPEFRYDTATGSCKNAAGTAGNNAYPLELVRETKQGECVVFAKGDLNSGDLGYPDLSGWLLAGADLSRAGIHFANLLDADLRGANMSGFSFGYAKVVGQVDEHTKAPQGSCKTEAMKLACSQ